jgi:hypothetical protein
MLILLVFSSREHLVSLTEVLDRIQPAGHAMARLLAVFTALE